MNKTSDNLAMTDNDAVESLLEKAAPRPSPPDHAEHDIREAVRAEWLNTTQQRRRRRFAAGFALAATVTLALAFTLGGFRQSGIAPVEVAGIDRSIGTLYVQSDRAGALQPLDTASLATGQILTTGIDSAAGLSWLQGGSLRVADETRIEFLAADEIYLHSGKVYFDSFGAEAGRAIVIRSAHGAVTNVGTQFMTESDATGLVVSVREGKVHVDGNYHDPDVFAGQRVSLLGSAPPVKTNTAGTGGDWQWTESVSPKLSVDGMTVSAFLSWVGRETGHTVLYETPALEAAAQTEQLIGDMLAGPREELRLRMMTSDINARFDADSGTILVTD